MAFPALLSILELQPFDFGKVIDSFIKHEPKLPHHLKEHFAEVEQRILESLAWQEGSPVHALLAEYDTRVGRLVQLFHFMLVLLRLLPTGVRVIRYQPLPLIFS